MRRFLAILVSALLLVSVMPNAFAEELDLRPRTVVTTDLECDDIDSLLHLLLYANDIDIAAIVVSASTHHWVGDGEHTLEEIVENPRNNGDRERMGLGNDIMEWRPMELNWVYDTLRNEYSEVYPNLVTHDPDYPSPGELIERTKIGNVEFEGDMREPSEGSDYIMQLLLDDDMRDIYLQAWGGTNTIGRALLSIEETYKDTDQWDEIYAKVAQKAVIISFGDQDNVYPEYISVNWPDIRRLYCVTGGIGYRTSKNATVPYRQYFQPEWLTKNIKFGHGALMSKYLLFGDGTYYEGEIPTSQFGDLNTVLDENCWLYGDWQRYEFISEGDSPCWMYLIPVGLRGLEDTTYGSWGGRMGYNEERGTVSAISEYDPSKGELAGGYSVHRWFPAFMNDWAARADWCVASSYDQANHEPVVTAEALDFEAYPGAVVELKASAVDPDGDELTYDWFVYTDACTYAGDNGAYLDVWTHGENETSFTVPADAQPGDIFNIVFEATDNGAPALTRYAQAIITVMEAPAEETAE